MLENAGPLRNDGSDKFWGMENVSPDSCHLPELLREILQNIEC